MRRGDGNRKGDSEETSETGPVLGKDRPENPTIESTKFETTG